jgi:hypothetical protein
MEGHERLRSRSRAPKEQDETCEWIDSEKPGVLLPMWARAARSVRRYATIEFDSECWTALSVLLFASDSAT